MVFKIVSVCNLKGLLLSTGYFTKSTKESNWVRRLMNICPALKPYAKRILFYKSCNSKPAPIIYKLTSGSGFHFAFLYFYRLLMPKANFLFIFLSIVNIRYKLVNICIKDRITKRKKNRIKNKIAVFIYCRWTDHCPLVKTNQKQIDRSHPFYTNVRSHYKFRRCKIQRFS